MDISTKVNIALCILSFLLAMISVITVVITLRQNHKMIHNSTRPYITISAKITDFQRAEFYLQIKNFGSSGAVIKEIKSSIDIKRYVHKGLSPFEVSTDLFLAPGESIVVNLNSKSLTKDKIQTFDFIVDYSDINHINKKKIQYHEKYPIDYSYFSKIVTSRASTKGSELQIISNTLQDLVEKIM